MTSSQNVNLFTISSPLMNLDYNLNELHFHYYNVSSSKVFFVIPEFHSRGKRERNMDETYKCNYRILQILDKFLQDMNYLTGPSLTVADLCCVATVSTATIITPISTQSIPTCPHGIEPARTFHTPSTATVWV